MKNLSFTKILITSFISLIFLSIGIGLYNMTLTNWFHNASFITIGLLFIGLVLVIYAGVKFTAELWKTGLVILLIGVTLQSCQYAKSNQQVLVSTDCGVNWRLIGVGESVPVGTGNYCFMKVAIPNYPMQGDSKFTSNFKDRVRASVHIDYDYSITNPLAFIKQAKFLGKANVDADNEEAVGKSFEGAENVVIDKRIKDVAKGVLLTEDIVELEQSELENRLFEQSNKILEPLGIHLNFITLTFDLDEQTRQAIDVSTAMKIYQVKGLGDVGKSVISARAGATKITVESRR